MPRHSPGVVRPVPGKDRMMTAGREETAPLPVELIASLQKALGDFQVRSEGLRRAYDGMRADFKNVNLELDKKNIELRKSLADQGGDADLPHEYPAKHG